MNSAIQLEIPLARNDIICTHNRRHVVIIALLLLRPHVFKYLHQPASLRGWIWVWPEHIPLRGVISGVRLVHIHVKNPLSHSKPKAHTAMHDIWPSNNPIHYSIVPAGQEPHVRIYKQQILPRRAQSPKVTRRPDTDAMFRAYQGDLTTVSSNCGRAVDCRIVHNHTLRRTSSRRADAAKRQKQFRRVIVTSNANRKSHSFHQSASSLSARRFRFS